MKTYYQLVGKDKQLNEIVMAGSHDAGINEGDSNTKTQTTGIYGQAVCGARFFDLRVAAFSSTIGPKTDQLRAFHADSILKKDTEKTKRVVDVGRSQQITHSHLRGGTAGIGLAKILGDTKKFVTDNPTEFLILKFDKSNNWSLIAELCIAILGDSIYSCPDQSGNLNTKTLEELKGKVIVLFTNEGWNSCGIAQVNRTPSGILQWKNLYKKASSTSTAYTATFDGLQYYGKGGVSRSGSGQTGKINMNARIQESLMSGQGAYKTKGPSWKHPTRLSTSGDHGFQDARIMGIMYWTTTGLDVGAAMADSFGSGAQPSKGIVGRNDKMWNDQNKTMLTDLWGRGYDRNLAQLALTFAQANVTGNLDLSSYSSATTLKTFMPNIVMIDYVDRAKCKLIMGLNIVAANKLTATFRQMLQ